MQASDYKRILEDRKIRLRQLSEPDAPNGWYWRLDSTLWNGPYLQEHEAFQAMLDYLLVNTGIGVKVQQLVMCQQQVQGISVEHLHPAQFDCVAAAHHHIDKQLEQLM